MITEEVIGLVIGSNTISLFLSDYLNKKKQKIDLKKANAEVDDIKIKNVESIISIYESALKKVSNQLVETNNQLIETIKHIKNLEDKVIALEKENKTLSIEVHKLNEILKFKN